MWLEQAGFEPSQRVRIEVCHGRLVITPDGTTIQTTNPATAGVYYH
jgi:hypothetical protein